jgi:hypothetical protein
VQFHWRLTFEPCGYNLNFGESSYTQATQSTYGQTRNLFNAGANGFFRKDLSIRTLEKAILETFFV